MTLTIDLPEGLTIEELVTHHPTARCTPYLGDQRALPTKTTATSGIMRWKWRPGVPTPMDNAVVEIGDKAWRGHILNAGEGAVWTAPAGTVELWARLSDFPP